MFGIITSMIIGGIVGAIIGSIIGENEIRNQLQEDDAFYGVITDIQPNTLTIEEIDDDGSRIQYCELESEDGVSDDLYEGEIIYAYE